MYAKCEPRNSVAAPGCVCVSSIKYFYETSQLNPLFLYFSGPYNIINNFLIKLRALPIPVRTLHN